MTTNQRRKQHLRPGALEIEGPIRRVERTGMIVVLEKSGYNTADVPSRSVTCTHEVRG